LEKSSCLSSEVFFQIFSGSSIGLFKSASFNVFLVNTGDLAVPLNEGEVASTGSVG